MSKQLCVQVIHAPLNTPSNLSKDQRKLIVIFDDLANQLASAVNSHVAGFPLRIQKQGVSDLTMVERVLRAANPDILHITSHGDTEWIDLMEPIARRLLHTRIHNVRKDNLRGVLMDSCESDRTSHELAECIRGFVIGWSGEVNSLITRHFFECFYELLAQRHSMKYAFNQAKANYERRLSHHSTESPLPRLHFGSDFDIDKPLAPIASYLGHLSNDRVLRVERDHLIGFGHQEEFRLNLCGPPGTGKTALSRDIAAELESRYDAIIECQLLGGTGSPISKWDAMTEVIERVTPDEKVAALSLKNTATWLTDRNASEEAGNLLTKIYQRVFNGSTILLVLDDAKNDADVQALLPVCSKSGAIVSSKVEIHAPGLRVERVGAMAENNARELALKIVRNSSRFVEEKTQFERDLHLFLLACDYRVNAIIHMAQTIAQQPAVPISVILERLTSNRHAFFASGLTEDTTAGVFSSIATHYHTTLCDAEHSELLCSRLSVFPSDFNTEAAAAIMGIGISLAENQLIKWEPQFWVRKPLNDRWKLLDLEREYLRVELRRTGSEWKETRLRFCNYYCELARTHAPFLNGPDANEHLRLLHKDFHNLCIAWNYAKHDNVPDIAAKIALALGRYFYQAGKLADGFEMLGVHSAPGLTQELSAALKAWQADVARKSHLFTTAKQLCSEVLSCPSAPLYEQAMCHLSLSVIGVESGERFDPDAIERHANKALNLYRSIKDDRGRSELGGMAYALNILGELSRQRGFTAEDHFSKASDFHAQAEANWRDWLDVWGMATGNLYRARLELTPSNPGANPDSAKGLLQYAKSVFKWLGDPAGSACCDLGLATILIRNSSSPELIESAKSKAKETLQNHGVTLARFWDAPWQ